MPNNVVAIPSPVPGDAPWYTSRDVYARLRNAGWSGKIESNGRIRIRGVRKFLHVAVAELIHGARPIWSHSVDHIDRNPKNARPENLRWATLLQQNRNRSYGPFSLIAKNGDLWRLRISDHAGRRLSLSGFPTAACAMAARREVAKVFNIPALLRLPSPNVTPRRFPPCGTFSWGYSPLTWKLHIRTRTRKFTTPVNTWREAINLADAEFLKTQDDVDAWGFERWDRPCRIVELEAWRKRFGNLFPGGPVAFPDSLTYASAVNAMGILR